jgi:aspartate kinase
VVKDTESVHYEGLVSEYERLVQVIHDDHAAAAKSHIHNLDIVAKLSRDIAAECKEILDYRLAAERWHLEIDSRSKDRIVSFGEKLSCQFMAALLQDKVSGLPSPAVSPGN